MAAKLDADAVKGLLALALPAGWEVWLFEPYAHLCVKVGVRSLKTGDSVVMYMMLVDDEKIMHAINTMVAGIYARDRIQGGIP